MDPDKLFILHSVRLAGWSVHDIGNSAVPSEFDGVRTPKSTTDGVIALKTPVAVNTRFKQQSLQFQDQLARQPRVYVWPTSQVNFWEGTKENHLVQALVQLVCEPVNNAILRCKTYIGCWAQSRSYIGLSSGSSKLTRSSSSSSDYSGSGTLNRCKTRSGSSHSSRAAGNDQGSTDDTDATTAADVAAAAATGPAAAAAVLAAAAAALEGSSPGVPVYWVHMDTLSPSLAVQLVKKALDDQRQGLTTYLSQPRRSLKADIHFCATAHAWQQEQRMLPAATATGEFNGSVFVTGPVGALSAGGATSSQQLPRAGAAEADL